MASLTFYSDPACPWAWRTSLWVRDLQAQGSLDVEWKLFSLAEANGRSDPSARMAERVLAQARREGGHEALDKLLLAMSNAQHQNHRSIRDRAVLEDVAAETGFDRELVGRALDDPATEDVVLADHREASEKYGAFGVPWLVSEGQEIGFYGPVIDMVPRGEKAKELWNHVSWVLTQPYLYELKRERG